MPLVLEREQTNALLNLGLNARRIARWGKLILLRAIFAAEAMNLAALQVE